MPPILTTLELHELAQLRDRYDVELRLADLVNSMLLGDSGRGGQWTPEEIRFSIERILEANPT